MPIYEYVCAACGAETELMHKVSESPGDCPVCAKPALTKLISAAGFRLAGGGWYETDFKSGNKRNLAGDSGGESSSCTPTGCDKPGCAAKAEATA
ncbi:putative regulatory protein, FmdB family [Fontimonas thermophila]|uniref:Putative regulatory protein, FmdB family n=1 Tax=Fontimonas thermophila TaxID=1076937 RepID=A0A1I2ISQ4_9GAMM|nr:zinc ribbon domain-containing protein [Fontimonas thermophila]SFF45294.1 putative regulatory protein, FmdB family [Fontimonas thermophila]